MKKWIQDKWKILDEDGYIASTNTVSRELSECEANARLICEAVNKYEELKTENKRLRKALEVYADEMNWIEVTADVSDKDLFIGNPLKHGFEIAKAALKGGK